MASPQPQTIFRNYNQIAWLHARLLARYEHVLIPPLPEKPGATDADYVEKKRLQMERFLVKLFARQEIVESDSDVQYFLGESMVRIVDGWASSTQRTHSLHRPLPTCRHRSPSPSWT